MCRPSFALAVSLLLVSLTAPAVSAQTPSRNVTVSFGAGLNTVGSANHHIIPHEINIKAGDIVNFNVAGLHQIFVYNPGTTPENIQAYIDANNLGAALFINRMDGLYYTGINPSLVLGGVLVAGVNDPDLVPGTPPTNPPTNGPLPGVPPVNLARSGSQNRVESVAFTEPGTFLVICNVRPHFQDGMLMWVKVTP